MPATCNLSNVDPLLRVARLLRSVPTRWPLVRPTRKGRVRTRGYSQHRGAYPRRASRNNISTTRRKKSRDNSDGFLTNQYLVAFDEAASTDPPAPRMNGAERLKVVDRIRNRSHRNAAPTRQLLLCRANKVTPITSKSSVPAVDCVGVVGAARRISSARTFTSPGRTWTLVGFGIP